MAAEEASIMLSVGEIIRTNREEQKISQEALSYGICSVSNLSRIESGAQIPTRATYEALMQRMGLSPDVFPSFLNERELETFRLKHAINQKFIAGKYDEAEALLAKMENAPKLERVYQQFVLYCQALLMDAKGDNPAKSLEAMKNAVKLSVRDFDPKKILRHILTKDELSMLKNMAILYYENGEQDYGIDILYALASYIERKVVDDAGISSMYTAILHALTNWVGLKGRHEEVLRLCESGITRCVEYGTYYSFAAILFNKGYSLAMLGRKGEASKYIQEAYYINRARNKLNSCEIVAKFAQEHGIEL